MTEKDSYLLQRYSCYSSKTRIRKTKNELYILYYNIIYRSIFKAVKCISRTVTTVTRNGI